jgi:hypothetical protein
MRRALVAVLVGLSAGALARAADPDVTISLGHRQATAAPHRCGCTHTGAGNILVQQPSPDTLVVTLTGVAVATAHPCKDSVAVMTFDLCQDFEVTINKKDAKLARLSLEARVIGLLRSDCCCGGCGSASISCPAQATITPCGDGDHPEVLHILLPGRSVACGENLSVNDQDGPCKADVPAGHFTLHQQFGIEAAHPRNILPCKSASAEFAPDPALDPLWISAFEPFKGAQKKEFGFQVTIKASAAPADENGKKEEPKANGAPKAPGSADSTRGSIPSPLKGF